MVPDNRLKECIDEVLLLSLFKSFCELNSAKEAQQKLRNIFSRSSDAITTTSNIIKNQLSEELTEEESENLYPMIKAFLNRSPYRKSIPDSVKKDLLKKQNNKCAICGAKIDIHSHADHAVPFKYVGDEFENNYQMLCTNCNLKKNASIDYQIRFLLKTI
jgi:tRNA isopentenyl-2-thiomethyl-A-37 hydroxylase MiaE